MFTPVQARVVAQAIINRYDNNEGTVNEIIAANYSSMSETNEALVKAAIIVKRPDIDVEA